MTAYIGGSMIDYTVEEATDGLVDGSRAIPKDVEEFWTFTRRAGLNFWMLSAVQTSWPDARTTRTPPPLSRG